MFVRRKEKDDLCLYMTPFASVGHNASLTAQFRVTVSHKSAYSIPFNDLLPQLNTRYQMISLVVSVLLFLLYQCQTLYVLEIFFRSSSILCVGWGAYKFAVLDLLQKLALGVMYIWDGS